MKTLSYLGEEQQQKYRDRQSISFMYTKPPGLDAALARDKDLEDKARQVGGPGRWRWCGVTWWGTSVAARCWPGLAGAGPRLVQAGSGKAWTPRRACSSLVFTAWQLQSYHPSPPPVHPQEQLKLAAAKQAEAIEAAVAVPGQGAQAPAPPDLREQRQQHKQELDRVREDPFAAMLAARMALQQDSR
jgi:hypothetical protein